MKPYYQRDGITIFCGECSQVLAGFEPLSFDLTVTSPPYDDLREYESYTFDFDPISKQLWRVTKKGGVVVWVVADQTKDFCESLTVPKQKIHFVEVCGFNLLDTMFYEKLSYAPAYPNLMRYASVVEYMLILSKGKPKTFNVIRESKTAATLLRQQNSHVGGYRQRDGTIKMGGGLSDKKDKARTNLWKYTPGGNYANDDYARKHPAVFPEALARDHIISWSNPGDLVLDPMMGSGTTLKMAMEQGRRAVGIDISGEYCRIAVDRLRQPSFWSIAEPAQEPQREQLELFTGDRRKS